MMKGIGFKLKDNKGAASTESLGFAFKDGGWLPLLFFPPSLFLSSII